MSAHSFAPIHYGDWLKAASVLQPRSADAWRRLAELLLLDWNETAAVAPDRQSGPTDPTTESKKVSPADSGEASPHPEAKPEPRSGGAELPLLDTESATPQSVWELLSNWRLENLPQLESAFSLDDESAPVPPALVPAVQLRGVITAACAAERLSTSLDLAKIIPRLTRVEVIRTLPRCPRRDLAAGIQLMLDRGSGMQPFHADQESLRRELPRWLRPGICETWSFRDDPGLGVYSLEPGRMGEKSPYRLPPLGRPILFVSDACLGPGEYDWRADGDWLVRIAASAGARNSRVLLLTPLPQSRCPRALRQRVVWLTWDRNLTSHGVLKQLM